jgi:hypothetical protein
VTQGNPDTDSRARLARFATAETARRRTLLPRLERFESDAFNADDDEHPAEPKSLWPFALPTAKRETT